jgi:hypothetical protein
MSNTLFDTALEIASKYRDTQEKLIALEMDMVTLRVKAEKFQTRAVSNGYRTGLINDRNSDTRAAGESLVLQNDQAYQTVLERKAGLESEIKKTKALLDYWHNVLMIHRSVLSPDTWRAKNEHS